MCPEYRVTYVSGRTKRISSLQTSLPKATLAVLDGQQHNAMDGARELLAERVTAFLLRAE
jgi:hypothetical protein